jgi:hypothetical protein
VDLLAIARKLWRYKLVTLPIVFLTFCGAVYVVAIKSPVYETTSSYIMINPPPAPTDVEIARDPSLGRIKADNPFARFGDGSVVVDVLASSIANKGQAETLLREGVDPRYKVESGSALGFSSPILKITAQGASPAIAVRSAKLVGGAVIKQLNLMQKAEGIDSRYWIKAQQVETPDDAQLRPSGQLRMLVGVLALGTILLFIAVSVADAVASLRSERLGPGMSGRGVPGDELLLEDYGRIDGPPGIDPESWPELTPTPRE